jgi:hypothetical protein
VRHTEVRRLRVHETDGKAHQGAPEEGEEGMIDWGVVFYVSGSMLAGSAIIGLFYFLRREA